jgi:hypothetical protein
MRKTPPYNYKKFADREAAVLAGTIQEHLNELGL